MILAVGGWDNALGWHRKAETLDLISGNITEIASFPFGTSIRHAPVVALSDVFYIFGGVNEAGPVSRIVALISGSTWVNMGVLNMPRNAHNALWTGRQFMVIGGEGDYAIEMCNEVNGQMTCEDKQPILSQYSRYPEVFLVRAEFCQ